MACFRRQDWAKMLTLVTDDIERWEVGAPTPSRGKKELDRDIRPGPDVVKLESNVTRMVEEGDVVVAEGTVEVHKENGNVIAVRYLDLFEFDGGKIQRVTAYTVVV